MWSELLRELNTAVQSKGNPIKGIPWKLESLIPTNLFISICLSVDTWLNVVCPLSWSGSPKCLCMMLGQAARGINPSFLFHALHDRIWMPKVLVVTSQLWHEQLAWVLRLFTVYQGHLVSKQLTQAIHWGMNSCVQRLADPSVPLSKLGCSV